MLNRAACDAATTSCNIDSKKIYILYQTDLTEIHQSQQCPEKRVQRFINMINTFSGVCFVNPAL